MQIYLARDNVQAGPYTLEEVNTMLASEEVLLADLMWHSGMDSWQSVGVMTGGQQFYNPSPADHLASDTQSTNAQNTNSQNINTQSNDSLVTDEPKRRLTVAELYGKAPSATPTDKRPDTRGLSDWQGRHATPVPPHLLKQDKVAFASIGSRCLAFAINMVLFMLTMLPLQLALINAGFDQQALSVQSVAEYQALVERLTTTLPKTALYSTFLMMVGLAIVQLMMLARRGQSLGKLCVGIRIVDDNTYQLANKTKVLGLRTVVIFIIYQVVSAFANLAALALLSVNYFMASKDNKKQGWHDKLSKTVVVKAHPSQLPNNTGK